MRQSFNRPPFHRRILPWIFIAAFLAVAPAVVFYTAGYRWNPKKGKIEQNGTVILDSTPANAAVTIDGRSTTFTTPVTIQNMGPGLYRFTVSKPGYSTWEKNLDIQAERVTFANSIWLWKQEQAVLKTATTATRVSLAPDERTELVLAQASTTSILIMDSTGAAVRSISFPHAVDTIRHIVWSANGQHALLEPFRQNSHPWLVDTQGDSSPLELPVTRYRWSPSSDLIGEDGAQQLIIHPTDMSVTRVPFAPGIRDIFGGAELRKATSTESLIFTSGHGLDRGLILPFGNWLFWSQTKNVTLFRDGDRWLAVQDQLPTPEYHMALGDLPRPFTVNSVTRYLLIRGSELWLWNPLAEPELLYRQSDRLVATAWHRSGANVFFATESSVFALNLDARDGYLLTKLSDFDRVQDMTVSGNRLIIAGTKDKQTGIWEVPVE